MENLPNTCSWIIADIREEAPRAKTLVLEAVGQRPSFIAGQYLTVRLPGFEPAEGKSYSISSSPHEAAVCLTIKEIGAFSKALLSHKIGDLLTTSVPYGFFYPDQDEQRDLAFVAGGIGITPCLSIIQSLTHVGYEKNFFLFYSNRTNADTVFKNRLTVLVEKNSRLHVHYFITRGGDTTENTTPRRMTAEDILPVLPHASETDFFLCGSTDFTKSMWQNLKGAGIQNNQMYTEGFY